MTSLTLPQHPQTTMDELDCYLAADVEDVKEPLMWWYEKHATFPRLYQMARNYLSIPGVYI